MNDIDPNNPPAFPGNHLDFAPFERGMTLRDYFAGMALMGMMASRNPNIPRFNPAYDTAYVYAVADAMLKERAK